VKQSLGPKKFFRAGWKWGVAGEFENFHSDMCNNGPWNVWFWRNLLEESLSNFLGIPGWRASAQKTAITWWVMAVGFPENGLVVSAGVDVSPHFSRFFRKLANTPGKGICHRPWGMCCAVYEIPLSLDLHTVSPGG